MPDVSLEFLMESPTVLSSQGARPSQIESLRERGRGSRHREVWPRELEDDDRMEEISAENRYTLKQSSSL